MSLVEAPAYIFSPIFMNKYGRKVLISGTHIIAGLSFLGIVLSTEEWHIHFWLLGKFAISCSFMSIYMFASEVSFILKKKKIILSKLFPDFPN